MVFYYSLIVTYFSWQKQKERNRKFKEIHEKNEKIIRKTKKTLSEFRKTIEGVKDYIKKNPLYDIES